MAGLEHSASSGAGRGGWNDLRESIDRLRLVKGADERAEAINRPSRDARRETYDVWQPTGVGQRRSAGARLNESQSPARPEMIHTIDLQTFIKIPWTMECRTCGIGLALQYGPLYQFDAAGAGPKWQI